MQQQRITGLCFVILGLLVWVIAPSQSETSTSAMFPRFIGLSLSVLGAIHALCLGGGKTNNSLKKLLQPLLLQYYALVSLTIIGIQFVGFYPSMLVFLPICAALFGARNKLSMGIFTIAVTGIFYLVLDLLLGSSLP